MADIRWLTQYHKIDDPDKVEMMRKIQKAFGDIAEVFDEALPECAEKSAGMRKMLEAKDCLVRAALT